jgi:hypothetical protein
MRDWPETLRDVADAAEAHPAASSVTLTPDAARQLAQEIERLRAGTWRPISEAVKGNADGDGPGPVIWAKIRDDLVEHTGRADLDAWAGVQVPLRHPGVYEDSERTWDHGWHVAAPVGHGGIPDDWIAGWVPLKYERS